MDSTIQTTVSGENFQLPNMISYSGNSFTIDDSNLLIEDGYSNDYTGQKPNINILTTAASTDTEILMRNCNIKCLTEDYNCNQNANFIECNSVTSEDYPFICASDAECSVDTLTGMTCNCQIDWSGNALIEQCELPPGNMEMITNSKPYFDKCRNVAPPVRSA